MNRVIVTTELRYEQDLVLCRQRVRQVAELLGFDRQEQTRIATAVSEIVRNAFEYAGGGKAEVSVTDEGPQLMLVTIRDSGPGISDLESVLGGRYVSKTGMGLGIIGAKRLMERFEIESKAGSGTTVMLGKPVPSASLPVTALRLGQIADELAKRGARNPLQEVQQQNQELLRALAEVEARETELEELNRELEETNRGVVALYAELDEKAAFLKKASEVKTSFLSNMTHEFRTPLNSILGLTQAALSEDDGELAPEHRKQLTYIKKSAESLSELVNDLLDIAKVEAGKIGLNLKEFGLRDLLGSLRGVLKPLAAPRPEVCLAFEEPEKDLVLRTDEGKVAQILRNLVSNALKYTEQGQIRVSSQRLGADAVSFSVSDTGIGIASDDQERIFDEFVQIESPLQKRVKGTGLGLSLSRTLARLLGGELTVSSDLGQGSVFTLVIPVNYASAPVGPGPVSGIEPGATGLRVAPTAEPATPMDETGVSPVGALPKILIIDDEEVSRYLLRDLLSGHRLAVIEATDGFEGVRLAGKEQPRLIFLDLQMPAMSGFYVLELLKSNPMTKNIPVVVHTAMTLTDAEKRMLAREAIAVLSKGGLSRELLKQHLSKALFKVGIGPDQKSGKAAHG